MATMILCARLCRSRLVAATQGEPWRPSASPSTRSCRRRGRRTGDPAPRCLRRFCATAAPSSALPLRSLRDDMCPHSLTRSLLRAALLCRLKEYLRKSLYDCGWHDELKAHCKGARQPPAQTHRPRRPAQEAAEVTEEIRLRPRVNARRGDQDEGHGEDRGRGSSAGDHTPWPRYASPQTLPRSRLLHVLFWQKPQTLTNPVMWVQRRCRTM